MKVIVGKLEYDGKLGTANVGFEDTGLSKEKKLELLLDWAEDLIMQANEMEDEETFHQLNTLCT